MLATKNRISGAIFIFALALFISGCTPPGPRALLKGKKLLDRGEYPAAVEQLKTATTLLATNAAAWNYFGVALQGAGQPADAAAAYQRAFMLNRDLMEAHYNLGVLWLEQNRPDAAKTEFTAYTLRRANAPEGWLKLGSAQLRLGETAGAEKSFRTVLSLNPTNAEALNGFGLTRMQRGQPKEAAQYFAAAMQYRPDYAPAILNLATVAQQNLRDNKLALQNYRAYLALKPHPANWEAVDAIAKTLEQPATVAVATPQPTPVVAPKPAPTPVVNEPKPQTVVAAPTVVTVRPAASPKAQTTRSGSNPPPRVVTSAPPEVVRVQTAPVIVSQPVAAAPEPEVETPVATEESGGSKLNPLNWFRSSKTEKYVENRITPLPANSGNSPVANSQPLLPTKSNPSISAPPATPDVVTEASAIPKPAPPVFPRYAYLSPGKPKSGDRVAASQSFTQARQAEEATRWDDALRGYQQAATADPGWYEAQYNLAVVAARLRSFTLSLSAYERALALQPDSDDTRFYFAQTLKAAGYPVDAVNELNRLVSANPNDVRVQLALGNLYAQQLRDSAKARGCYLKVLKLDPANPEANRIRFWLASNPA